MSRIYVKSVRSEEVKIDEGGRTISAYFSIFGNRDRVGDIVHPGAFRKTISEKKSLMSKGMIPAKYNHDMLVGSVVGASEDNVGGLAEMKFMSDPASDRIFRAVKDGFLPTFSFKYSIPEGGSKMVREGGKSTRHLHELELIEAGPVDPDLAANDATHVRGSKGLMELAGAIGSINALDCDERWAMEAVEKLTDEERGMLAQLSSLFENLGGAARSIMLGGSTGEASSTTDDEYEGESMKSIVSALEGFNERFVLGRVVETFSGLPARIRATGN